MSNKQITWSDIRECNEEGVKRMKIRKPMNAVAFPLATPMVLAFFLSLTICLSPGDRKSVV